MDPQPESLLISRKITPTPMRLLVLQFLKSQPHTVSLTDIETGMAPADRVTIYRTLKTFEEKGLVHLIDDGSGAQKYALCEDCAEDHSDLHIHFSCSVCEETYCLPQTSIPEFTLPQGFRAEDMQLTVKGVCDQCS
jgi:Fur family ferric uptake transcriptional regulator